MTQLVQSKHVVEMIVARRGSGAETARNMIVHAVQNGKLVPAGKLKYGKLRFIHLFDPDVIEKWLEGARKYKPAKSGDRRRKENRKAK